MFVNKKKVKKSADLRLFKNLSWPEKFIILMGPIFIIYSLMVLIWWLAGW